jgi:hypothetical protein
VPAAARVRPALVACARVGGAGARGSAVVLVLAAALGGCGGGERQDAGEPDGSFPVDVTRASFPAAQRLAGHATLRVAVRNAGRDTVPNLALTLTGPGGGVAFAERVASEGSGPQLADASRPVWILDGGPADGETAYDGTWALGRLAPGKTKEFAFRVTPVRAGSFGVAWRVDAGLGGRARATQPGGGVPRGSFSVRVSRTPADPVSRTHSGG